MEMYYFSASENGFMPGDKDYVYVNAGTWPSDAIEVSAEVFYEYTQPALDGKVLGSDKKGLPAWVKAPAYTKAELVSMAEQKKLTLLTDAKEKISLWQTELQLGVISDDDKRELEKWVLYIKSLINLDVSSAPDIEWPSLAS